MGHGKQVCMFCKKVVSRCRCPNHDEIENVVCGECGKYKLDMTKTFITLEEWFEVKLPGLKQDLLISLDGMGVKEEDQEGLLRVLMISIRDHVSKKII